MDDTVVKRAKRRVFDQPVFRVVLQRTAAVRCGSQVLLLRIHCLFTDCAQVLGIQLLPYFSYLLANEHIKLNGLFNLFNGMNGGCVVFAAKFLRNLREGQVELASE